MKRGRPPKSLPDAGAIVAPDVDTFRVNRTELDANDETALRHVCDDAAFVAAVQNAIRTAVVVCDESADDPNPATLRDAARRVRIAATVAADARTSGNPDAIAQAGVALADAIHRAGAWSLTVCGMPEGDGVRDPARLAASAAKREATFANGANPRGRLRDVLDDELRGVFRSFGLSTTTWAREPGSPYGRAFAIALRAATGGTSDILPESSGRDLTRRRNRRKATA